MSEDTYDSRRCHTTAEGGGMSTIDEMERKYIAEMFTTAEGVLLKMQEHKPPVSLVPRFAIEGLAEVYEYGVKKYQRDSWRQFTPDQAKACLPDAAMRHLLAYNDGEFTDKESGLPHLLQCAWNCLTLYYFERG